MDDIHGCGIESWVDEHLEELKLRLPLKKAETNTQVACTTT